MEDPQLLINALIAVVAIQFLVIGLLAFNLNKNIPPQVVEALFNIATRESAKTVATWDDEMVERVKQIYADLQPVPDTNDSIDNSKFTIS